MSPSSEEKRAGLPEDFRPRASVIVCAYSNERLPQLKETIASLQKQTYPPSESVLIIDHNPELQEELERLAGDTLRIALNRGERGLANARNTGIGLAEGEVLAFIDDDAAAESRWLEELVTCYQDPALQADGPLFCEALLFRGGLESRRAEAPGTCRHQCGGWLSVSNAAKRCPARGSQCRSAEGCRRRRVPDRHDRASRRRGGRRLRLRISPGQNPPIGHRQRCLRAPLDEKLP